MGSDDQVFGQRTRGGSLRRDFSERKLAGNGASSIKRNRRSTDALVATGLSVIAPVTSFLEIHISFASTRNALGKRTAWLLPVVKTLAVAVMNQIAGDSKESVPYHRPAVGGADNEAKNGSQSRFYAFCG